MSDTTEGPTLHLIVEAQRIDAIYKRLLDTTQGALDDAKQSIDSFLGRAVSDAYREGLRDGFAQGCIAESKSAAERAKKDAGVAS